MMKRIIRSWVNIVTILVSVSACTSLQELEVPDVFSVSNSLLTFSNSQEIKTVSVKSGAVWTFYDVPEWIKVEKINSARSSHFEWNVDFLSMANEGYDREGIIVIKAGSETIEIQVSQSGKKGKYVAVESVSLSPAELTLTEGESASLTVKISPSNASEKTVQWTSGSPSVATIDADGKVHALTPGTTVITVKTDDGGKTATCSVTVNKKVISVTGVSLDKSALTMTAGDTQTLTATVTPSNATDKSVTWSSDNTSVATVSSSGVVTAKAAGTAIITVKTNDGGKTATCTVTVKAATVSVTGVSLDKTSLTMTIGDMQTLTATITPSNATNKSVTWSSSNKSVATVSSSGVVTGQAVGTATITVTTNDGGKTATCTVKVQAATVPVTGVSLNKTSLSMTVGDTQTLTATVTPSNATNKNVSWSSSNTSVATVSSSGVVTAKVAGTATITVKTNDGGKTAKCTVTVKNKDVNGSGNENTGEDDLFGIPVPEAVDLGLSVKWASFNLGASKPEEFGYYYAWGETSPKTDYSWNTYKWGNTPSKYNSTDGLKTLEPQDDAVRTVLKGNWRMPTLEEETELYNKCTLVYTQINGINGFKFTGPNGNSIFLPAAGLYDGSDHLNSANSGGWYWSSTASSSIYYGRGFYFFSTSISIGDVGHDRCDGHVIRPVYAE